jgi:hypothetical protein
MGDTSLYVVSGAQRLQLQGAAEGGVATMYRPQHCIERALWSFDLWMDFNPSSYNFADVYVVADVPPGGDLVFGYFVRIGYSTDEISLYRRDGDRITKIIDGVDGATSASSVAVHIEVTRSDGGTWHLYSADVDNATALLHQGTTIDSMYKGNNFYGIQCRYTTTRRNGFHFDNIRARGDAPADTIPPLIDSVVAVGPRHIDVLYSEPLFGPVALRVANYSLSGGIGQPTAAAALSSDHRIIRLELPADMQEGIAYRLTVHRFSDPYFNTASAATWDFVYVRPYEAAYRDVVINEIFADPLPQQGLPAHEYVELYNTTDQSILIGGWLLEGASSKPIPEGLFLEPGAYLFMANERDVPAGQTDVVSWGTGGLLNNGESLTLIAKSGMAIDSLTYDLQWYRDVQKSNGGWSLEQINPYHCSSDSTNWRASADSSGGTPLAKNSVYDLTPDRHPPRMIAAASAGSGRIVAKFNEWIDPATLDAVHVEIVPPVPVHAVDLDGVGHALSILLDGVLTEGQQYTISISGIADCAGNTLPKSRWSFVQDGVPPYVRDVLVFSGTRAGILFSEAIDESTLQSKGQVVLLPHGTSPAHFFLQSDSVLIIDFADTPALGEDHILAVSGFGDTSGNALISDSIRFRWNVPVPVRFNDIIVTEIMADPSPPQDLPAVEYIELHNPGSERLLISDLVLAVGARRRTMPAIALDAGQYVALCPSAGGGLPEIGNKILLRDWFALANRADTITLYNHAGEVLFNAAYSDSWYRSAEKTSGGWSLEMIDTSRPCAGADNWMASMDAGGGTPGRSNSVSVRQPDLRGPALIAAFAAGAAEIKIRFNEKLHPMSMHNAVLAIEPPAAEIISATIGPLLDDIAIVLSDSLLSGTEYIVSVDNVTDCSGNLIVRSGTQKSLVLPEEADNLDVVINEVLYDPRHGGVEFVELYNRSGKHIDMRHWVFALERAGAYYRRSEIAASHMILKPGAYLVLTTAPYTLKADYPSGRLENFYAFAEMPPLSDGGTTVVLIDRKDAVIDRFSYHPAMHHPWLDDAEGVSLERIRIDGPTNDAANWASAAQDHAYATPGLRNSQTLTAGTSIFSMSVEPDILIPGSGGAQSVAELSYSCAVQGMIANVSVHDVSGRLVKKIARNANLGSAGTFQWYGRDLHGTMVLMGHYILVVELFGPDGSTLYHKETIAVAGNFAR